MKLKLIKDVRLRDLFPRPYLELDEGLTLRAGVEWVPQMDAALGVELSRQLTGPQAERILPHWERLREKGLVD